MDRKIVMMCAAMVLVALLVAFMGCIGPAFGGNNSGGGYSGSSGNGGDNGGGSGNGGSSGTGAGPAQGSGGDNGNGDNGGSSGNSGNSGSHGGSPGSYSKDIYFSLDCHGVWSRPEAPDWAHVHGSFAVTGNIPFHLDYDYHKISPAIYTDSYGGNGNKGAVVRIQSEYSEFVPDGNGHFLPCHFTYDGYQYASADMVYNTSEDSSRRWTATFSETARDDPLPAAKLTQTEPSCPKSASADSPPSELVDPAETCFTTGSSTGLRSPFPFSDSSTFTVLSPVEESDLAFSTYTPSVTFHMGRAPS